MGEPFAVPGDVAAIWRPLSSDEETVAAARLAQASALVRTLVPQVDSRIANGSLDPAVVIGVCADMVLRVMLNPGRVRTHLRTIDGYTESDTLDNSVSAGSLYLTPEEEQLLRGRRSRAFSITPTSGERWDRQWLSPISRRY